MLSKAAQVGLYSGMQAGGAQKPMPGYPQAMPNRMPRPNPTAPTKPSRGALVARMAMYGPKFNSAMQQLNDASGAQAGGDKTASLSKEAAGAAGRWIAKTLAGLGWKAPMQYAYKGVDTGKLKDVTKNIQHLSSLPTDSPASPMIAEQIKNLRAQQGKMMAPVNDRYGTIAGTAAALPLGVWLSTRQQPQQQQPQQQYPQE
jgi:hypothetical protein